MHLLMKRDIVKIENDLVSHCIFESFKALLYRITLRKSLVRAQKPSKS